jgi:FSR family fosmidomycin resistance protein-like MFS transporter
LFAIPPLRQALLIALQLSEDISWSRKNEKQPISTFNRSQVIQALEDSNSDFQLKKVLVVSGGHCAHDIYSSFLSPFLPLIIEKFGITMTLAGLLTFFFRFPSFFSPLLGIISDRVNMRHLAVIAPGLTAVMMSLLGMAPCYGIAVIFLLVAGISATLFHVLGPVMIARVSRNDLGKGMSYWMIGGEFSRTIGPLLAVWAVSVWTFEGSYPIMIFGILASILLHISLKDTDLSSGKRYESDLKKTWKSINRVMVPLTGIMLSGAFMTASLVMFLPTYMVAAGKSLWFGGVSLAVLEFSGTLGIYFGGTLSDRVGRRTVFLVSLPAAAILLILFVYAPDWLILPLLIPLGCMLFAIAPVKLAIVQDYAQNNRGMANGLYMGISFLISAGITVVVGWLADLVGIRNAFLISAFLAFAGVFFVFLLPESQNIKRGNQSI